MFLNITIFLYFSTLELHQVDIVALYLRFRNCVWWHLKHGLHPSRKVSVQAWPRLQHRRDPTQRWGRMVWKHISLNIHGTFFILVHFVSFHVFYIYAFSRRFYPKRLTVHSGYTFVCQYVCSLGIEPTTFCAANAML